MFAFNCPVNLGNLTKIKGAHHELATGLDAGSPSLPILTYSHLGETPFDCRRNTSIGRNSSANSVTKGGPDDVASTMQPRVAYK